MEDFAKTVLASVVTAGSVTVALFYIFKNIFMKSLETAFSVKLLQIEKDLDGRNEQARLELERVSEIAIKKTEAIQTRRIDSIEKIYRETLTLGEFCTGYLIEFEQSSLEMKKESYSIAIDRVRAFQKVFDENRLFLSPASTKILVELTDDIRKMVHSIGRFGVVAETHPNKADEYYSRWQEAFEKFGEYGYRKIVSTLEHELRKIIGIEESQS